MSNMSVMSARVTENFKSFEMEIRRVMNNPETQDRKGYKYTLHNSLLVSGQAESFRCGMREIGFEDYDVCAVFPVKAKKPHKTISAADIEKRVMVTCRGRREEIEYKDRMALASLSPEYNITADDLTYTPPRTKSKKTTPGAIPMPNQIFHDFLIEKFQNWARAVGCDVLASNSSDGSLVFFRMRLTEAATRQLAESHEYPLQIDRTVTEYDGLKDDSEFVAPFYTYEDAMEKRDVGANKTAGRVWTRYDRLNQAVRDANYDPHNPELSIFRDIDRVRLLLAEIQRKWHWNLIEAAGIADTLYVLEQPAMQRALQDTWGSFKKMATPTQPLKAIRDYFGEQVALMFAWQEFYAKSLLAPAVFGFVLYILQLFIDPSLEFRGQNIAIRILNLLRVLFSLFIVCWATLFVQCWKRRQRYLELCWGMRFEDGMTWSHEEIASFKSDGFKQHPVDPSKWIRSYSTWKRALRLGFTSTVTCLAIMLSVVLVNEDLIVSTLWREGFTVKGIQGHTEAFAGIVLPALCAKRFGALVIAIVIRFLDKAWTKTLAFPLTRFENHQWNFQFEESVIGKLFSFKFVDYFSLLIYIGFIKEFVSPCTDMVDGRCVRTLRRQLFFIFILAILDNCKELLTPLIWRVVRRRKAGPSSTGGPPAPHEIQYYKLPYSHSTTLIEDWTENLIQFGLVALFSLVYPLLPLLAFAAAILEMRTDAVKIIGFYRRPLPCTLGPKSPSSEVAEGLIFLCILSNIGLVVFATVGHHRGLTFKLALSLILMLIALGLRDLIAFFVPVEGPKTLILRGRMHAVAREAIWGEDWISTKVPSKKRRGR